MNNPLKGIIPPMVTPLNSERTLDTEGLERLIEHQISGGVHGLFILGTNGEAPSLSYNTRKDLIRNTCNLVQGRIPILVGITDTSLEMSLEISEYAKSVGADAVVVAPPYYFPVADEELVDYFDAILPRLTLPFLVYNMPSHTKVHLSVDIVKKARDMGAIGIKDSSGDLLYFYTLIEAFKDSPEFSVISGTEIYLPETIRNGGHGAVAGGANMFPKLFVDFYDACLAEDQELISKLREKVMMLYQTIYQVGKHNSRYVKGTKCVLSVMGLCDDYMAPPLHRFNPAERDRIEAYIEQINTNS